MQPSQPTQPQPNPTPPSPPLATGKKHRTLALVLLIGPTALFIVALSVTFLATALFPNAPPAPGEVFSEPSAARRAANIFGFLSGAIVVLTWLPGLIIGTILLVKK